eukprot:scaffold647860_cov46-Prasinocladus_malaysianus.AAC.2
MKSWENTSFPALAEAIDWISGMICRYCWVYIWPAKAGQHGLLNGLGPALDFVWGEAVPSILSHTRNVILFAADLAAVYVFKDVNPAGVKYNGIDCDGIKCRTNRSSPKPGYQGGELRDQSMPSEPL